MDTTSFSQRSKFGLWCMREREREREKKEFYRYHIVFSEVQFRLSSTLVFKQSADRYRTPPPLLLVTPAPAFDPIVPADVCLGVCREGRGGAGEERKKKVNKYKKKDMKTRAHINARTDMHKHTHKHTYTHTHTRIQTNTRTHAHTPTRTHTHTHTHTWMHSPV